MATLARDLQREYKGNIDRVQISLPVIASDIIYAGAAVCESTTAGTVKPGAGTDTNFIGFADTKADNSAGAASAIDCVINQQGLIKLTVVGVTAITDLGDTVYLTDDNTFTLTSSGGLAIGKLSEWVSGTTAWVYFQGVNVRSI